MTTAVLDVPKTHTPRRRKPPVDKARTFKQLQQSLGDIPAERIRVWPHPGTATLADLIENNDGKRLRLCELIDGTLVEKTVGLRESQAAMHLGHYVMSWNESIKLGFVAGEGGSIQVTPSQVRLPDFAFYSFERLEGRKRPPGAVPLLHPDFAVEVLSKSNTKKEMGRKRLDYFGAGTRLVWEVDLKKATVTVYHDPDNGVVFGLDDTLSGEDVLPGFTISIRKWLDSLTPE